MAKKKTETKKRKPAQQVSQEVMDSVHSVWLAGLGALAKAEEEGGKLFRQLVDRGERMTGGQGVARDRVKEPVKKAADAARRTVGATLEGARHTVDEVRARGSEMSEAVDQRVDQVLRRLGVPSRAEIESLTQRVEELNRRIAEMDEAGAAAAKPTAEAAKKPAGKKAAGKKVAGKKATAQKAATAEATTTKAATKKSAAKKSTAKKSTAEKAAPKKSAGKTKTAKKKTSKAGGSQAKKA